MAGIFSIHPIIVSLISVASIFFSKYLSQQFSSHPNTAKQELAKSIKDLKEKAEELNNPSTYAAFCKHQRQINTLEKQLADMKEQSTSTEVIMILKLMPYLFSLLFIGSYYDLNISGTEIYWPINSVLGYQEDKIYMLSLFSWYLVSLNVIKQFL